MSDDRQLVASLIDVAGLLEDRLGARLRVAGVPSLNASQTRVFLHIHPGSTPSALARSLGVTRQSMQKILAGTEVLDLTFLAPNPSDRRSKLVHLTPLGIDVAGIVSITLDGFVRRMEAGFGTEAIQGLRRLLDTDWTELLATEDQNAYRGPERSRRLSDTTSSRSLERSAATSDTT